MFELGQAITYMALNDYMRNKYGPGPFTGTVTRRNKNSVTVAGHGGIVTVPHSRVIA